MPRKPLSANDPRHGTVNGYNNLGCCCEDCTQAIREYQVPRNREWRHRAGRTKPLAEYRASVEAPHGTESRYARCKCSECREAARVGRARRRARAADAA